MPARTSSRCCGGRERAHADVLARRIADRRARRAARASRRTRPRTRASGTSTRRIAVHFWPVFCVMSRTTSARNSAPASLAELDVGAEDRGVEPVGLDVEAHAVLDELACVRSVRAVDAAAGERDDVAGARGDRAACRPGRSAICSTPAGRTRLEQLREAVRDERGRRRRLRDHRHAGEQRARELLAQAPRREVERVDVHRDAARGAPTRAGRAMPRGAADLDRLAVGEQRRRAPSLRAELGVVRERDRAAVDVELGVAARVAAVGDRERDQLLARAVDRLGERGEQGAALGERQPARARGRRPRARRRTPPARSWPPLATSASDLLGRRVDERRARSRPGGPGRRRGSWRGAAWRGSYQVCYRARVGGCRASTPETAARGPARAARRRPRRRGRLLR